MRVLPSGGKGLVEAVTSTRNLLALGFGLACLLLVLGRLGDVNLSDVKGNVSLISGTQWAAALLATGVSFLLVGQYDALFHRWLKTGVKTSRAIFSGASAIALAQTLGMGLATGTLSRWRCLPELSFSTALKVTNYVSVSFMLALGLISALALFISPQAWVGGALAFASIAVLLTFAAIVLSILQPHWLPVQIPPLRLMFRLTGLATLDVTLAALALWVLLPAGTGLEFATFFAAFVIAIGAGLLSGAPGGVGPFELCLITLLPTVPETELIAAVIGFRLVYYALPACCAVALMARPSSPKCAMQGNAPAAIEFTRAEAKGLVTTTGHRILPSATAALHVAEASQTLVNIGDPANGGVLSAAELRHLSDTARHSNLWPALYKIGPKSAAIARQCDWTVLPISDEAWVDPQGFTYDGSARRQLRRKLNQAAKAGVVVDEATGSLPLHQMAHVAASWAQRMGGEHGFSMGRFEPNYVAEQRCFLAYKDAELVGFATFHATASEWVLDLMRSTSDMPDGTMHQLVAKVLETAAAQNATRVSLAAMPRAQMPGWMARLPGMAATAGLRRFKMSFDPNITPLYAAAPNKFVLAMAGIDIWLRIHNPPPLSSAPNTNRDAMHFLQGGSSETIVEFEQTSAHVSANKTYPLLELNK